MTGTRLLDLSRLVSRLGRGALTGIDRVELAYLQRFLHDDAPLYGLVQTAAGWLLLNKQGCTALHQMVTHPSPLPKADLLSRLLHRANPQRAQAETAARGLSLARASRLGLSRMLRRLPAPGVYFNVGHSNLSARALGGIDAAGHVITVLIHDTIPLDHPEFARPDTIAGFERKLRAVSHFSTRVVHISNDAKQKTEAHFRHFGRVPPGIIAPLGVETAVPDWAALPAAIDLTPPYFVTIGTIEPRKNHALLLDVWDRLPNPKPRLFIIGGRGWANQDLLARLDALPAGGAVQVWGGLTDGAVSALLKGAAALLAPSKAEGFGLPPVEAASLGTAVIASDLAVTREILMDKAVYLDPADIYSWAETVLTHCKKDGYKAAEKPFKAPNWEDHFKLALSQG